MAFLEIRFPLGIGYGSRGGPSWKTSVIEAVSGSTERIQRWTQFLSRYDVKWGIRDLDDFHDVRDLWMQTKGAVHGFRFRDLFDCTTKPEKPGLHTGAHAFDDYSIGTGDGTTTQFQLSKKYTVGAYTHSKNIYKPVAGTTLVGKNGVNQASGWSVDTTTGIVTFTTAPLATVDITAGCEFDVPVQFAPEMDDTFTPTLESFEAATLATIGLQEMTGSVTTLERRHHGGGSSQTIEATTVVNFAMGSCVAFDPKAAHTILMPDESNLDMGNDYFDFENRTTFGSYALTFKTHDGLTTLWTMAAGDKAEAVIYDNGSGVHKWGALKGT